MMSATKKQWQLINKSHTKILTECWTRHVKHVMGRVRIPVKNIFTAAALGWFGHERATDSIRQRVMERMFRKVRHSR